jgi:hypothetical protein
MVAKNKIEKMTPAKWEKSSADKKLDKKEIAAYNKKIEKKKGK